MGLTAELFDDVTRLEHYRAGWDGLAVEAGRPYCAPGWMLSWWHEVAASDGLLRVTVVRDGADVVGVVPLWARVEDGRHGLLAERTSSPVEPLARPGLERAVADACAELLAAARPKLRELVLQGLPARSPWPGLLLDSAPDNGGAAIAPTRAERVPKVTLSHDSIDAWLATRSRNFRQQVRHSRRRLADAGARFRISTLADLDRDVGSLARLHHARWAQRGGSRALDTRVVALLRRAGRELIPLGRFRLWSIDVDGRSISCHLFVAAGAGQAYWLGGFDDAWGARHPSIQVLVAAVAHGIEQGEDWVELGPGRQPYKYRLADSEDGLAWVTLSPARA
jgi:CelD/BcsL family acetyltransferase involved in cellulose biosynthesis